MRDLVTVVCTYSARGPTVYNFLRAKKEGAWEQLRDQLAADLDAAPTLAAFNAARFDAPFLMQHFGFTAERVGAWVAKTIDVFEACRNVLNHTFKLDTLLRHNGLSPKTASGLAAVEWAKSETTWPKLEEYCTDDARLTYEVSKKRPHILIPPGPACPDGVALRITPGMTPDTTPGLTFHIPERPPSPPRAPAPTRPVRKLWRRGRKV